VWNEPVYVIVGNTAAGFKVTLISRSDIAETSNCKAPSVGSIEDTMDSIPIKTEGDQLKSGRRLEAYLASFASNETDPHMGYYPGLPSRPWHDASNIPIVAALEDAFLEIQAEIKSIPESTFHKESERIPRTGAWDVLMLYERGYKDPANCRSCPVTVEAIKSHATIRSLCGLICVSRLRPGTRIAAYRGPTNMRLRCHLALSVPVGDCAIRVHDETRRWQEGRCLVFDDYFAHEAWNETSGDRVVLVVDIWHPDLSRLEIAMLEGLQRYAIANANSLSRYFAMNARARAGTYL
jgi:hypothetical protein